MDVKIEVYVCPTPGCGNYYGTKGMDVLGEQFTGPRMEDKAGWEEKTGSQYRHSRAECPDCRQRGTKVERARVTMMVTLPAIVPPTPDLPAS